MDAECTQLIIEALKEEEIDLFVTLPEEPTASLTRAVQDDPYFTCISVASEGSGIALCAGASIGGRRNVFVTGVADASDSGGGSSAGSVWDNNGSERRKTTSSVFILRAPRKR